MMPAELTITRDPIVDDVDTISQKLLSVAQW